MYNMISMDFVSLVLVGLSFIFNIEIDVVDTRIIPSKNVNLQSYGDYDYFDPDQLDFTLVTSDPENSSKNDTRTASSFKRTNSSKFGVFEIKTQYLPKNNVNYNDDEDYEFSGSGEGSGEENDTFPPVLVPDFSDNTDTSTTSSFKETNSSKFGVFEITTQYLPRYNVNYSDDEDYELSGSGEGSGGENETFPLTFIPDFRDNTDISTTSSFKGTYSTKFGVFKITTQYVPRYSVNYSDDEDYESSGSGKGSGEENDTDPSVLVPDFSDNTDTSTTSSFKGTNSSKFGVFEITTHFIPRNNANYSDDEDYELSGSGEGSGEENDTYPSVLVPDFSDNTDTSTKSSFEGTNSSKFGGFEITTQYLPRYSVNYSDDEDYESSGSGKGSGEENDTDPSVLVPDFSDNTDTSTTSSFKGTNSSKFGVFEITTHFIPRNNANYSDDEDYELSGSGEGSGEENIIDPSVLVPDFSNDTDTSTKSSFEGTNSSKFGVFQITTQFFPRNNVNYSDDEDYELSGSGEGSGEENDTYPSVLGPDFSDNTTSTTISFEGTNSSKFGVFEITTQFFPRNNVNYSDDEDYELSGSGEGSGEENDTYPSVLGPDFSDNTTSATISFEGTNSSKFGGFEITTQYLPRYSVNYNDDEDYEFSGSGEGSGEENDIDPSDLVPDFSDNTDDTSTTSSFKGTNSSKFGVFEITSQFIPRNNANYSDDEDYELSGSGEGSGEENIIDPSVLVPDFSNDTDTSTKSSFEGTNSSKFGVFQITTQFFPRNNVNYSDDEDYELSGSGEGSGEENDTDPSVLVPDFSDNTGTSTISSFKRTNSSKFGVSEKTTQYLPKNNVNYSDDEDYELSGSGEGSGEGHDTDFL